MFNLIISGATSNPKFTRPIVSTSIPLVRKRYGLGILGIILALAIGIPIISLLAYVLGWIHSHFTLIYLNIIASLVMAISIFFIPFCFYYLIGKGRNPFIAAILTLILGVIALYIKTLLVFPTMEDFLSVTSHSYTISHFFGIGPTLFVLPGTIVTILIILEAVVFTICTAIGAFLGVLGAQVCQRCNSEMKGDLCLIDIQLDLLRTSIEKMTTPDIISSLDLRKKGMIQFCFNCIHVTNANQEH
jgi:hypothetical protein